MRPRHAILAALLLPTCPALAWANVAVHVYQDDPEYRQTALTHLVIAFAWCMTALFGFLLAVRRTGFKRFVGVGCFLFGCFGLLMYFLGNANLYWLAGNRPPGSAPGPGNFLTIPGTRHGPPRHLSPPIIGIILALVVSAAGWWLSRCFRAKQSPPGGVVAESVAAPEAR